MKSVDLKGGNATSKSKLESTMKKVPSKYANPVKSSSLKLNMSNKRMK